MSIDAPPRRMPITAVDRAAPTSRSPTRLPTRMLLATEMLEGRMLYTEPM